MPFAHKVFQPPVRPKTTTYRKVRGFTLIELMVVVVIIAILAVIAVPLFAARMQARRLMQTTARFADLYRGSRTRALARGAAVVVTLNPTNDSLTVLEGVLGTAAATASGNGRQTCGNLPTRGCLTNDWGNLGGGTNIGTARFVEGIGNENVQATYAIGNTPLTANLSICFSPAGRTFFNTTGAWNPTAWQPLTSPVTIVLAASSSTDTTRTYSVVVLPNGTARLSL